MTSNGLSYANGTRLGGSAGLDQSLSSFSRPNDAAGLAALNRSLAGIQLGGPDNEDTTPYWERRPWDRMLNDELLPVTSKQQEVQTLETLVKLMENVLALPAESDGKEKERTIRLKNPKIRTDVVEVKGAFDLLIQSGFRRIVEDFEEKLTFPLLPSSDDNKRLLSRLRTGKHVLSEALEHTQKADELERMSKEAAEADKTRRMTGVLEDIKADREMVKKRDERERAARRRAKEAKEIQEKAVREASAWDRA
ncbi:hypothetical protein JCM6882_005080 [Rhodosporidiobolus microsporus]